MPIVAKLVARGCEGSVYEIYEGISEPVPDLGNLKMVIPSLYAILKRWETGEPQAAEAYICRYLEMFLQFAK